MKDRYLTVNHGKYASEFIIRGTNKADRLGSDLGFIIIVLASYNYIIASKVRLRAVWPVVLSRIVDRAGQDQQLRMVSPMAYAAYYSSWPSVACSLWHALDGVGLCLVMSPITHLLWSAAYGLQ